MYNSYTEKRGIPKVYIGKYLMKFAFYIITYEVSLRPN